MINIINELNQENGSNHKIAVLTKHKNNLLLKQLLKMTYDEVNFTYGITMRNIVYKPESALDSNYSLKLALNDLDEQFAGGLVSGNAAIAKLINILSRLQKDDAKIIEKVINRDLRINLGTTNINKVFKNLINSDKPVYSRCAIYGTDKILPELDKKGNHKIKKGTANNISFTNGAIIQLKADGTYREISKSGSNVRCFSRSGESYYYPAIEKAFSKIPEDGHLTGELTVRLDSKLLTKITPKLKKIDEKNGTNNVEEISLAFKEHQQEGKEYILPRSIGNGLINSDDIPYDNLIYDVWDFISDEDYALARLKDRKNLPKETYKTRFENLKRVVAEMNVDNIRVIEHEVVYSLKDALAFVVRVMKLGFEGAILKDWGMLVKDGTSLFSLKMKIAFTLDVRITGFVEGTPGTKREKTFGSMTYSTDDGMIKGSVSGFNDEQLADFNSRREALIGEVMEIEGNDLTRARGSKTYAVSHPRFNELRTNEKETTDDLARAKEMLESAKEFS